MTAATSRTPRTPWTTHSQSRPPPKSTTTPHGLPNARIPPSVGQAQAPLLTPQARSPSQPNPRSPSPNYFGLIVEAGTNPTDSNAGGHVKKNWKPPPSSTKPHGAASPQTAHRESSSEFEDFLKHSESNAFRLDHGNLSSFSSRSKAGRIPIVRTSSTSSTQSKQLSPRLHNKDESDGSAISASDHMDIDLTDDKQIKGTSASHAARPVYSLQQHESPVNLPTLNNPAAQKPQLSHTDERHPRLSMPHHRVNELLPNSKAVDLTRASTLPASLKSDGPKMIAAQDLVNLVDQVDPARYLLLDLRVSPQYAQSRIKGALNLCIPTTLLKRPSFNVQKLSETFTIGEEREKFAQWQTVDYIVVYDASSAQLKDASSSVNTIKKFTAEGWKGTAYIIRGGFLEVSKKFPKLVEKQKGLDSASSNRSHLSIDSGAAGSMPVAGGCPMPVTRTAANPFFGNIRQNMDLIGGVGQLSIKQPDSLTHKSFTSLPAWLRETASEDNNGKVVADRFLHIEKAEQSRMQSALSANVSYGTPQPNSSKSVQVAGIEKGSKNRYKDILPFDHSRVRLQDVASGDCDYVNASHVKAEWSNRHYIATQAPVPTTFEDFWRVVWEQDARVIVMLTAELEGGQRKCHPYWIPDNYGPMKLKALSEKKVPLENSPLKLAPTHKKSALLPSPIDRPTMSRRRATNPHGVAAQEVAQDVAPPSESQVPHVVVRKLTLSHASYPFQPMREITQLQYSNWPDFGAPAHPADLLGLINHCNSVVRSYNESPSSTAHLPGREDERPIIVHCSAGCGRTGTFCTADSVIDMLKRQREAERTLARPAPGDDDMDVDTDDWVGRDDIDLIYKTVEDFRLQRLSMVQTLRQYVLCYETVLEWLVKEMPEKFRRDLLRRSYQG